jgi:uncharacterized membrane protein
VDPGSWTAVPSATTVGPLNPNQTAVVNVTVTIPSNAPVNEMDTTIVSAISQQDIHRAAVSQLTTTALSAGVNLSPPSQTKFGDPGQTIEYTLSLTNTSAVPDTFTLTKSGNVWVVGLPSQVGPVAAGGSVNINVTVTIPPGADPGNQDTVTVKATSQNSPSTTANATIQTIVANAGIYLPIILRDN